MSVQFDRLLFSVFVSTPSFTIRLYHVLAVT
jgi:hypothetical protein